MAAEGLNVILASDDPGLFPTTLLNEYHIAADDLGWTPEHMRAMTLAAVDASWLEDSAKSLLRETVVTELDAVLGVRPTS